VWPLIVKKLKEEKCFLTSRWAMAAIFYGNGIEGSEKVKEVHFAAKIKIKFIIV